MSECLKQRMRCLRRHRGASLVEYAIILSVIAAICFLVLRGIGTGVNNRITPVNETLK